MRLGHVPRADVPLGRAGDVSDSVNGIAAS